MKKFIEEFAYTQPVYSRENVLQLIKECFPDRSFTGVYNISTSIQLRNFDVRLRELGNHNAETIVQNIVLDALQ